MSVDKDVLGKRVVLTYASGPGSHAEGWAYGYCDAPSVDVVTDTGKALSWRTLPGDQIWDWKQPKHCLAVQPGGGDFPGVCVMTPGHSGRHRAQWLDGNGETWDAMERAEEVA